MMTQPGGAVARASVSSGAQGPRWGPRTAVGLPGYRVVPCCRKARAVRKAGTPTGGRPSTTRRGPRGRPATRGPSPSRPGPGAGPPPRGARGRPPHVDPDRGRGPGPRRAPERSGHAGRGGLVRPEVGRGAVPPPDGGAVHPRHAEQVGIAEGRSRTRRARPWRAPPPPAPRDGRRCGRWCPRGAPGPARHTRPTASRPDPPGRIQ